MQFFKIPQNRSDDNIPNQRNLIVEKLNFRKCIFLVLFLDQINYDLPTLLFTEIMQKQQKLLILLFI